MTIYQLEYEVPWQLSQTEYETEQRADGLKAAAPVPEDGPQSLASFAALLAGADTSAVVECRKGSMTVEMVAPLASGLAPGTVLRAEDHLGPAAESAIAALLTGRSAWLDCLPLQGFRSAALIAAPSLAASRYLVLVASTHGFFDKRALGLAAAYVAQAGHGRGRASLDLRKAAA
jgi:hypothetical protein